MTLKHKLSTIAGVKPVTPGTVPPFAFVASTLGGLGVSGGSLSAINTTGATFLAVQFDYHNTSGSPVVTDTYGNTWTYTTAYASIGPAVRMAYCLNPVVGAGHVVTVVGSAVYTVASFAAFSGRGEFDTQNGNAINSLNSGIQSGAVTPRSSGALLLTTLAVSQSTFSAGTVDSGFTILGNQPHLDYYWYGLAFAYKIQSTAVAINPSWSFSGNADCSVANIVAFTLIPAAPDVVNLQLGELSLNTADGKVYMKLSNGNLKAVLQ